MNKLILLFFSLLVATSIFAQEMPESRTIALSNPNGSSIRAQIAVEPKSPRIISQQLLYHCFIRDSIHQIQGGYEGHLLHGQYTLLTTERAPLIKGQFSRGLKHGEWKSWYANGRLKQVERWRDGRLHGPYQQFDSRGQLLTSGKYRKGRLHGKQLQHDGGEVIETIRYKKGQIKTKKERWLFKGKKKDKQKGEAEPPEKAENKQ